MMHLKHAMPMAWAIFSLSLFSTASFAQGNSEQAKNRHFGIGHPKSAQELPNGKLRRDLESLPSQSRAKALEWLQRFEFPVEDIENIQVNEHGDISYADTFEVDPSVARESFLAESSNIDEARAFSLHSRPGASNVVYLDFDGHILEGTAWSSDTLVALPFDPSQNDSPATEASFTQDELNAIHEIWHRVAEDFAPFNIDVTTEEPAVFTPTTGRVLFTHHTDASGQPMPSPTSGGIAYVDVFGRSDYVSRYSPALIYYTNLADRSVGLLNYNAEVASHEFGHNLGLSHDGATDGTTYYAGSGEGLVSWGPVMGYMLDKNVTQWSKGEYPGANNTEDDVRIIAGDLGVAGDDHGDSSTQATALVIEPDGRILVSNPELDPDNVLDENKGVINDRDDTDWFFFDVSEASTVSISATPAWHAFTRSDSRGANLDIELALMDAGMNLLAIENPDDDTRASISISVQPGRYFIQIDGVGNTIHSDYSDYASIGMYFIEGVIGADQAGPEPDTLPPEPAVMAWQSTPQTLGESSITMTAVEASDDSGVVEYLFTCVAGGQGCTDSGWQSSRSYTASGLDPDTYYAFKVRARDPSGNQNVDSDTVGDRTATPVPAETNQPPVAVASYSPEPAIITKGKTATVTLDGTASTDPDGQIASWKWTTGDGTTVGESAVLEQRLKEGLHPYTLTVTDNEGASAQVVLTVSVTVPESDGGGGGGGKGKPPKG